MEVRFRRFNGTILSHSFVSIWQVYNLGMYGAEYAWILQDTYISSWWLAEMETPGCSSKALLTAVENLIIVSSYNSIVGMGTALSGLVSIAHYYFNHCLPAIFPALR